MKRKSAIAAVTAAALALSLAACGAKQYPMQITVVNRFLGCPRR